VKVQSIVVIAPARTDRVVLFEDADVQTKWLQRRRRRESRRATTDDGNDISSSSHGSMIGPTARVFSRDGARMKVGDWEPRLQAVSRGSRASAHAVD
jgi:hypothetical protein